jgi:hypothetical protein
MSVHSCASTRRPRWGGRSGGRSPAAQTAPCPPHSSPPPAAPYQCNAVLCKVVYLSEKVYKSQQYNNNEAICHVELLSLALTGYAKQQR